MCVCGGERLIKILIRNKKQKVLGSSVLIHQEEGTFFATQCTFWEFHHDMLEFTEPQHEEVTMCDGHNTRRSDRL